MDRLYNQTTPITKWWERIALWFVKEESATDDTDGLHTTVYLKRWRGRIYLTDIIHSFTISPFVLPKEKP